MRRRFRGKKKEIAELILSGKPYVEIAQEMATSLSYVYNVAAELRKVDLARPLKSKNATQRTAMATNSSTTLSKEIPQEIIEKAFRLLKSGATATELVTEMHLRLDEAFHLAKSFGQLVELSPEIPKEQMVPPKVESSATDVEAICALIKMRQEREKNSIARPQPQAPPPIRKMTWDDVLNTAFKVRAGLMFCRFIENCLR
jgi:hypothetical protein